MEANPFSDAPGAMRIDGSISTPPVHEGNSVGTALALDTSARDDCTKRSIVGR